MKRVLVTGGGGMLAAAVGRVWRREAEILLVDRMALDVCSRDAFAAALNGYRPDAVVNCAALTDVDGCEKAEDAAMAVNAYAVRDMGVCCQNMGIPFLSFSSDYVFDGAAGPYTEYDIPVEQLNVYGASKALGEKMLLESCPGALIIRTSWLYGGDGPSFVHTMLRLAQKNEEPVRVVNDQFGAPTWTDAAAKTAAQLLLHHRAAGIVHCVCENWTSWYGLAKEVFVHAGADPERVVPVSTAEFPRPARRPADSRLVNSRLKDFAGCIMPDWQDALDEYFRSLRQGDGELHSL